MPITDDEIADNIVRRFQSRENDSIVRGLDQDKNKAAGSIKLGNETGGSPERILNEYDKIYQKSKGEAAQQIVEQEPWLRQYVRENPLGSAVSQDDWGALGEFTKSIRDFNEYSKENIPWIFRHGVQGTPFMIARALPEVIEDVKGGIKAITDQFTMPQPEPVPEEDRLPSYLNPELQRQLDDYVAKNKPHLSPTALAFGALQILGAPLSGVTRTEFFRPVSEYMGWREDLVEGLTYTALLVGGAVRGSIKAPAKIKESQIAAQKATESRQLGKILDRAIRTFERAETWIESGERPPIGVDPALDQLIGLESINRMTALDAIIEKANKTETKELSPESLAELSKIAFRDGDRSIYLRWDAAKSLYGDKLPEPGDKLLGDVPRIAEQFARSRDVTHEPIEIPMEMLPGLDSELYKLIGEDLFFEGGMDRRRAKELVKLEPEISTIHEREMPGLSEDLRRPHTLKDLGEGLHEISNEHGEKTGQVRVIEQEGGKNLFIAWEKGQYDTAGLITLMNQLKQKYPNAETISTVRVPGTASLERALQGSTIEADIPFRIKDRLVDNIRRSAGLEPLFDLTRDGPRAVRLVRGKAPGRYLGYGKEPWTITDEMGQPIGSLELDIRQGGKEIYVGWIGSAFADMPEASITLKGLINRLGPSLVRSLVRQLKEAYPDAEEITGNRISGAREKREAARERAESAAGKTPRIWSGDKVRININRLLDEMENMPAGWEPGKPLGPEHERFLELISQGYTQIGDAMVKPYEPMTLKGMQFVWSIEDFLEKVIGDRATVIAAEQVLKDVGTARERGIGGAFLFATDIRPFILWSTESPDPFATAGHEAIHFLRHYQFIRPEEWEILKKAAKDGGWLERPEMDRYAHYKDTHPELFLEEAIADEFKRWAKMSQEQQQLHGMAKVFQKIKDFVDHIKSTYREMTGQEPTADNIFRDIQLGRVAKREPLGVSPERKKMFGLAEELPEEKRVPIEGAVPTFAPGAIMDKKKYAQYQRHMGDQNANDIRIDREKAIREANKRNAPEWKAAREEMRDGVAQEIGARPDFRARAFFQNGTFFGATTHYMPKVDPRLLTKEQRAEFPARWQDRAGMDPDTLAQPFGYQTGAQLIDAMIQFEKAKGSLTPKAFFEKVVDKETDRRMELKYGDLAEKNLQEALEQVVGHDQLELLSEEAVALAERGGMKISLSKEDIKAMAHTSFLDSLQTKANYKYFFQEMYRAGKEAESRFLAGDYIGAFQEKWMQVHLFEMARQVKLLDKQRDAAERVAKRFYKRYPDNFPPEYTEFIQQLLMNAGYKVDRHPDDLAIAFQSREHKGDLRKFADDLNAVRPGEEKFEAALDPYLIIPDFIMDNWPNWRKNVKDMTVGEFKAFNDAIQSLQKIGAEQGKLHRLGEEADFQKEVARGRQQLTEIGPEKMPMAPGKKPGLLKRYHVGTVRPEDLLIRLDKGNENGFFTQFITDPLNDRAYYFDQHHKAFRQARIDNDKKFGATKSTAVFNDVFHDPRYMIPDPVTGKLMPDPRGWSLMPLTHEHVRGVLLNWGNKSNRERLVEGFHVEEATVEAWLKKVATKDDWKWAEAVGKMYKELLDMGHEVTMRESNTMVEALPLPQIDTPFGKMDGWYYPIHYDKALDGGPKKTQLLSPAKNTRTYRGWERKRTGPAGPLELHLNSLDMDMNRRIHDLAFREVLRDFRKILNDPGLRNDLTKHMGREYYDMLKQLHDDIAQPYQADSGALAAANKYSEWFRQNTIMMLVGMKIGTFMKHVPSTFVQSWARLGLTKMDFWQSAVDLGMTDDKTSVKNWTFVHEGGKVGSLEFNGSREIKRRWQHYAAAHGVDNMAMKAKSAREFVMQMSSVPIAFGDMISSTILWNSLYKKLRKEYMEQGMSIEEAHTKADTRADFAVRQTHGSTSIVGRPEFMRRTSSAARWFTSLYSYYNHVYGQFYRMAWRTKDAITERQRGDPRTQSIPQYAAEMASLTMAYVAMPAAFYWIAQDWLIGKEDDEEENLAWKMAAPFVHNIGGAFLGVRDIIGLASGGGQQPAPGIVGVPLQKAWELGQDVKRWLDPDKGWKEEDPGKFIKHLHSLTGVATGMSSEQVGMWNQFIYNYLQAIEEPEGPADWYRGMRRGTIERRKRH